MEDMELMHCRTELEKSILKLEAQTLGELVGLKRDVEILTKQIEALVTRPEFHPVQMIAYGLAGGVLITALGSVMAKVLGW
jgi:hypothetical protein